MPSSGSLDASAPWSRWLRPAPPVLAILVAAALLLAGAGFLVIDTGAISAWWAGLIVLVGLFVIAANLLVAVRIDERGVRSRSALGFPSVLIPLAQVESASVVEVSPMRDFGGWGFRAGRNGTVGVILRSGPSLQVTRRAGRSVVVTVDDAHSAVALIDELRGDRPSVL